MNKINFNAILEEQIIFFEHRCGIISKSLSDLREKHIILKRLLDSIESFAVNYDFDEKIQANGYRSFVETCEAHFAKLSELFLKIKLKRDSYWFQKQRFIK